MYGVQSTARACLPGLALGRCARNLAIGMALGACPSVNGSIIALGWFGLPLTPLQKGVHATAVLVYYRRRWYYIEPN